MIAVGLICAITKINAISVKACHLHHAIPIPQGCFGLTFDSVDPILRNVALPKMGGLFEDRGGEGGSVLEQRKSRRRFLGGCTTTEKKLIVLLTMIVVVTVVLVVIRR